MKDKHLTSQSGHAIINGFYEGNGSRRALIYKNDHGHHQVEMWEENKLRETRDLRDHSIHYAEDCAENWVTRVITKAGERPHISEDK